MVAGLGLDPAYPLAILLAVTEFAGGLMLIAGGGTLWASLALAIDMAVAVWKVHYQNGFFMNWTQAPHQGHGMRVQPGPHRRPRRADAGRAGRPLG